MQPEDLAWPILLLPLGAAIIITLCTRRWPRLSAQISIMAVASAFVLSSFAAVSFAQMELSAKDLLISKFNWISLGDLTIDFGLRYDSLSALMLLVVTGVGGTIHF